jgi:hypothetical protein
VEIDNVRKGLGGDRTQFEANETNKEGGNRRKEIGIYDHNDEGEGKDEEERKSDSTKMHFAEGLTIHLKITVVSTHSLNTNHSRHTH